MTQPELCCEVISWCRFAGLARRVAFKIVDAGYQPDLIVAIARGGYAPARVLADYLGVMNVASIKVEHYHGTRKEEKAFVRHPLAEHVAGRRVLIVDDVSDTGDTYRVALAHLAQHGPPADIRTAALHHKTVSTSFEPDFYAARVVRWRWLIYPWAVIEDLSGFVGAMVPRPPRLDAIAERLRLGYGLRVTRRMLEDVISRSVMLLMASCEQSCKPVALRKW